MLLSGLQSSSASFHVLASSALTSTRGRARVTTREAVVEAKDGESDDSDDDGGLPSL